MKTKRIPVATALACALVFVASTAPAQQKKPNILIIWGDDIGYWNVSAYNQGMMGYKTPNIDRIAKEGALFTDWYGQQSCTAGRSALFGSRQRVSTKMRTEPPAVRTYSIFPLDSQL